jgi:hypothetical protein
MPPPLPSPIPSLSDPNTAGPGKIIIHCIRHAEASAALTSLFSPEANSLAGRTQQVREGRQSQLGPHRSKAHQTRN